MKSTRKTILAVCALAIGFAAPVVHAQEGAQPPAKKEGAARPDRLGQLKAKLELSDAQVEQVKKIYAEEREQMKALREKEGTREEKAPEMRKIRESVHAKIAAVLTAEQKAKFEEMRKNRPGPGGPKEGKGEKGPKGPPPAADATDDAAM